MGPNMKQVVDAIDVAKAEATMESDRTQIFAAINERLPGGFQDMNEVVKNELRIWARKMTYFQPIFDENPMMRALRPLSTPLQSVAEVQKVAAALELNHSEGYGAASGEEAP